ncbi:hypothetical protein L596_006171 [Steinernema carpocapsae]|uniref:Uncharacterized protein n=1 Tax=Steinernema carpocapsae TaxID=34508 RepID=A0A4U8V1A8_STECR|nr:hypothetical protein L596_006171 [Steinernema carpocapsae]
MSTMSTSFRLRFYAFLVISAFCYTHAAVPLTSYYWTTRTIECVNSGLNISRCALRKPGKAAELNPGCFEELTKVIKETQYNKTVINPKTKKIEKDCRMQGSILRPSVYKTDALPLS